MVILISLGLISLILLRRRVFTSFIWLDDRSTAAVPSVADLVKYS